MPFEIPNEGDASVAIQAQLDAVDLAIIQSAILGNGIWEEGGGCAVTAQGTPNTTVAVAEGVAIIQGRTYQVDAASTASFAVNDGTNNRLDLVVITSTGAIAIREGVEASPTVLPTPTAGDVVLAAVYIPSTETVTVEIVAGDIIDKRMFVPATGIIPFSGVTNDMLVPEGYFSSSAIYANTGQDNNAPIGCALYVPYEFTFDNIMFYLSQLLDSGADSDTPVVRVALYRAGDNGLPDVLITEGDNTVDCGSATAIAPGTTGVKTVPVNSAGTITIKPGLYFLFLKQENVTNSTQQCRFYFADRQMGWLAKPNSSATGFSTSTSWAGRVIGTDEIAAYPTNFVGGAIINGQPVLMGLRRST